MAAHAEFEIDIVKALSDQLLAGFEALRPEPLADLATHNLPSGQGVYQLFYDGWLVYVGKADSLPKRLGQHARKIAGRRNIKLSEMSYCCLYVHKNWTALAPETSLIKYFKASGEGRCEWNGNGFGPHDPGRQRETTNKTPDGFDAIYPIRNAWPCTGVNAGLWNVGDLLRTMKRELPFLLRFETTGSATKGHPDYNSKTVEIPAPAMPARELLKLIATNLPNWQATAFPSHMILYRESREYTHGELLALDI
jgi:hypothetical protein